MADDRLSLTEAAREGGVSARTLKRWAASGVIPESRDAQGGWGPAAVSHARMVARLRDRGHSLASIPRASDQGRLAYGFVEDTLPRGGGGPQPRGRRQGHRPRGLAVQSTLPESARVVKTVGDAVMIVGQDLGALVDWAVGCTELFDDRPEPRIGIHVGPTLYRDGDYFGREVNLASRVVARARGGEVLVTDFVVEQVEETQHLAFDGIGTVKLKGFDEPRTLCRAVSSAGR